MIHCTTCASIGRCEDAVRNGYVIKCIHFGELSRQTSFTISDPEETCKNCKYYHDILVSDDGFHIHDYCSAWMAQIPNHIIFDRLELDKGYDDIECGLARCWAFKARPDSIQTKFPKNDAEI